MSHLADYTLLSQYLCTVAIPGLADWCAFSRVDFADHVKSHLTMGPRKALDGRYVSHIHPCVSETSLRPSRLV